MMLGVCGLCVRAQGFSVTFDAEHDVNYWIMPPPPFIAWYGCPSNQRYGLIDDHARVKDVFTLKAPTGGLRELA